MTALDGMRILDVTQYEAGPSCTQALAWLGADVVKVERPDGGDPGRGPRSLEWKDSEYFVNWNSNKRSVTINLATPQGRGLLHKMIPHYDVFVENYGPGVLEKLELGYETVKGIHPGVIYASVKGFGHSGPYAHFKSYDSVSQAAAGILSVTGDPDGPPTRPGITIGDSGTGVQLALEITAAYVQKQRTGVGQLIELSMQEAMTYFMRTAVAMGSRWGSRAVRRTGNGTGPTVNLFPCKPAGPNDYVYIMCVTQRMWEDLCKVIERPDLLEDPRLKDGAGRYEHRVELIEEISKWTRERNKHEAMQILGDAGVPVSAVLDTLDLFNDPHLNERGFIKTIEHESLGSVKVLGSPFRMSESEVEVTAAPLLGKHTAQVLHEDLGLSEEEAQALREQGVIGPAVPQQ